MFIKPDAIIRLTSKTTDYTMACLNLTITMIIWMPVILLLSTKTGFGLEQNAACRNICSGSDCITVYQDNVDFQTAEETCRNRNGGLLTINTETDEGVLHSLTEALLGNFWIGLRLPAGDCSNLTAPLRGYEWTSYSTNRSFSPTSSTWKYRVKVCSPHCVTLSNDHKWTERLCSDKTDGYLCRSKDKNACQAQELSDPAVFQSPEDCVKCEHSCKNVTGGFKCHCKKGYKPDSNDPKRCILHCGQQRCPMVCDSFDKCLCPDGFISDDNFCEDINECKMDYCEEECNNTFGSYVCYSREDIVSPNQFRHFVITTPVDVGSVKHTTSNNTLTASSVASGGLLWILIFISLAVIVLVLVVKFCVIKHLKGRQQNSSQQQSTNAVLINNVE